MKFEPFSHWTKAFLDHGAFAHLDTLFQLHQYDDFPSLALRNTWLKEKSPFQLIADEDYDGALYYEAHIHRHRTIPTRHNWHDFFGSLIWCLFPKTKALLNALHMEDIRAHGQKKRTPRRNALTLFDECGVVMVFDEKSCHLIEPLKNHAWQEVFVTERARFGNEILTFNFGHANYEMLTKPFIGLTGKVLCLQLDTNFFQLSLCEQYQYLDNVLSEKISNEHLLDNNKGFSPLPLLGVPGWYAENHNPDFYNNTDYFRAKRRKTP